MPKSSWLLGIISIILLPLLGIVTHFVLFRGVDRPSSDHGSGSMFDLIAARYDMINRVLAVGMDRGWRQKMVLEIKLYLQKQGKLQEGIRNEDDLDGPKLLDISTGTADVALLLATSIPQAFVLGIDPSVNMLDVGRSKIRKQNLQKQIQLQQYDARNLTSLDENIFDAATMAFGIRNVPQRKKALCQIHRLLRDNSRFCILEFSEPNPEEFGFMGIVVTFFIRTIVPLLGGILSGAPREYWHLQNSIKDFPSPNEFVQQINQLSCNTGQFEVDRVDQLNFGSVQIYNIRTRKQATSGGQ